MIGLIGQIAGGKLNALYRAAIAALETVAAVAEADVHLFVNDAENGPGHAGGIELVAGQRARNSVIQTVVDGRADEPGDFRA